MLYLNDSISKAEVPMNYKTWAWKAHDFKHAKW